MQIILNVIPFEIELSHCMFYTYAFIDYIIITNYCALLLLFLIEKKFISDNKFNDDLNYLWLLSFTKNIDEVIKHTRIFLRLNVSPLRIYIYIFYKI